MTGASGEESLRDRVRLHVFGHAAETGRVPQPAEIAGALCEPLAQVEAALTQLAIGRALILAPNSSNIWAANPFCAVPSPFHVRARETSYRAICIWDALGIAAALESDALIRRHVATAAILCGSRWPMAGSRAVKVSFTSLFRPPTGGTTSATPDPPCCSSVMKSTWIAGALPGNWLAVGCSPPNRGGAWHAGGTGRSSLARGGDTPLKKPKHSWRK